MELIGAWPRRRAVPTRAVRPFPAEQTRDEGAADPSYLFARRWKATLLFGNDAIGRRMLTGILIVAAAGVGALLASSFMWWATKRSALWAMAAGVLLLVVILAGAVVIAWLYTRAAFGG